MDAPEQIVSRVTLQTLGRTLVQFAVHGSVSASQPVAVKRYSGEGGSGRNPPPEAFGRVTRPAKVGAVLPKLGGCFRRVLTYCNRKLASEEFMIVTLRHERYLTHLNVAP